MSDQHGKVLSFGPFELSIGNRLLTNGAKAVPLGARAMDLSSPTSGDVKPRLVSVNSAADISQTSREGPTRSSVLSCVLPRLSFTAWRQGPGSARVIPLARAFPHPAW
jgi:hypothetical protein